ncbi:MAG: imidazole glycerol phosphate synthase subunit HisH [Phycisphaeraceae bacterium]
MTMIGIIDYGMGNLRSVQKAFEAVGAEAVLLRWPDERQMEQLDKLVLPGVGAFADGMEHLRERGWIEPIRDFIASGRPFLGICLGMQLLFEGSEEDAPSPGELVPGLGVLPGKVVRFREEAGGAERMKVPHMGWNAIRWRREDPLLAGLEPGASVYFVHSYYVRPEETEDAPLTSTSCNYGGEFCASVWRDNVRAAQFHPEKSQRIGMKILDNFVKL